MTPKNMSIVMPYNKMYNNGAPETLASNRSCIIPKPDNGSNLSSSKMVAPVGFDHENQGSTIVNIITDAIIKNQTRCINCRSFGNCKA